MPGGAKAKTKPLRSDSPPPVDHRKIPVSKGGVQTEVDAIHAGWAEPREYVAFTWPPDEPGLVDGWLAGVSLLSSDLRWLLRRPYHRFWSQVVYDLSLAACIDSTLQRLPRPHELHLLPEAPTVRRAVRQVALLMLRVALRMATYKESKENHLSPALFARLVYDNYVWDMARLMDLCAVYAASNGSLLERQLATLFGQQPAYLQDLQMTVLALPKLLERVEGRVAGTELERVQLDWHQLWDVVQYLVDLATSLDAFLRTYPDGSRPFLESRVVTRIASFYDTVVPRLWRRLEAGSEDEFPAADVVRRHLQLARLSLVSVFRRVVDHCCLRPLRQEEPDGRARDAVQARGEEFLEVITECLAEQHFIADYHMKHPISDDLNVVRHGCPDLDPARMEFVLGAVHGEVVANGPPAAAPAPEDAAEPSAHEATETVGAEAGPALSGVELESMVSHVRDLLPDVSHSFVSACLEYYNYSSELVINALLEDSLPAPLAALDRKVELPRLAPTPTQPAPAAPVQPAPAAAVPSGAGSPQHNVLTSRHNIFDGDEFDVMSRDDVDVTLIHRGKRLTTARLARELADKSELRQAGLRQRYELFGSLSADGSVYEAVQYEDEYDDTYDDVATGQEEPTEETGGDSVMLNQPLPSSRWRRPDEPDEDEADSPESRRDQFVANPEEVRARQEARRQQQQQQRGRGGRRQGPPADADVIGRARGQGQTKQVLQNRRRKNENKSAQHRRGADRKHRGGMF